MTLSTSESDIIRLHGLLYGVRYALTPFHLLAVLERIMNIRRAREKLPPTPNWTIATLPTPRSLDFWYRVYPACVGARTAAQMSVECWRAVLKGQKLHYLISKRELDPGPHWRQLRDEMIEAAQREIPISDKEWEEFRDRAVALYQQLFAAPIEIPRIRLEAPGTPVLDEGVSPPPPSPSVAELPPAVEEPMPPPVWEPPPPTIFPPVKGPAPIFPPVKGPPPLPAPDKRLPILLMLGGALLLLLVVMRR